MQNRELDVLVIGGGPAGLSAARIAATAGARVLVVEREGEIGAPIRTSGASWLADLDELGIPRSLAHPLTGVRFAAPDRQAAWRFSEPLSCVLDVRRVWQHLAREAILAGAEIQLRTTALEPLIEEGAVTGVLVRDSLRETKRLRARVTIDASGSAGAVAVKAGLRSAFRRLGVGAEYELLAPHADQTEAWLLVGRQVADRGYAWMFPRGKGQVRLGVGVLRPESEVDPMRLLQRLMADPRLADALRGAQPLEYHAGALPAEPVEGPYSMAGLLLAGDSGAQASPLVGEGIRYAIRAGRLAGEIATRGDASAQALAEYDREWQRRFGQEMRLSWWLNRRLARYGDRNWRVVASLLARLSADQAADGLRGRFGAGWWLKLAAQSPLLLATAVSAALAGRSSEGQNPRV